VVASSGGPPSLNSRGQPASIGLSIVLRQADGPPRIDVCCTWGRYRKDEGKNWTREPHFLVMRDFQVKDKAEWKPSTDPYVRVLVRVKGLQNGNQRVSIFIVNQTPVTDPTKRPPTISHVFQPQIRVRAGAGTEIAPMEAKGVAPDAENLELLYLRRKAFARGHLCSATWGSVDPSLTSAEFPPLARVPFGWPDGETLNPADKERFLPQKSDNPDVEVTARTEFIPAYSIESPEIGWDTKFGPSPELQADKLAELYDPKLLTNALTPMITAYKAWLETIRGTAPSSGSYQAVAIEQLEVVNRAASRIQRGIDLLVTDPEVRLAFCFMNRTMALQSEWTRSHQSPSLREPLVWRPFQLAFILHALEGMANEQSMDRNVLDLLWFPTGGGKTESYLGLAILALALRRRRTSAQSSPVGGAGVGVISRYTLRLLTIQQFRRALSAITAADYLRIQTAGSAAIGWHPQAYRPNQTFIWGGARFSLGLWVGGAVTPNALEGFTFKDEDGRLQDVRGAIDILQGAKDDSEPAQILNCPCCNAILAAPNTGLEKGTRANLHLLVTMPSNVTLSEGHFVHAKAKALAVSTRRISPETAVITLSLEMLDNVKPELLDSWLKAAFTKAGGAQIRIESVRASRPGYFLRWRQGSAKPKDFEVICVNPACELGSARWIEYVPKGVDSKGRTVFEQAVVSPLFRDGSGKMKGMPIPGYVVDDQVYNRCPSMIVATVDKFARLAFEPRAAALYGNIDHYHPFFGYYRAGCPPDKTVARAHPLLKGYVPTQAFAPPDLIIQDELHLIEGPLGTMVGLYEAALDELATRISDGQRTRPKYVASTATIRAAKNQVQSLFDRDVAQFPPPGLTSDDSFFARTREVHARDESRAGRLYLGFAAPGKGSQTPVIRAWAALLQRAQELRDEGVSPADLDPFWTLIGYFNAIKELARATGLCRIDIPQWIDTLATRSATSQRQLDISGQMELSSRAESHILPSLLTNLATSLPGSATNIGLATAMFGTGVDVDRLGLMFLQSQPKTTSTYIQATGRIGRKKGGLVITFLGAGRPRDLAHYEFFVGFHRAIHKTVEPVTVAPFSPRARERALGPLAVLLLRNAIQIAGVPVAKSWPIEQRIGSGNYLTSARQMATDRFSPEVAAIIRHLEGRAQRQPTGRLPAPNDVAQEVSGELDKWHKLAQSSAPPDGLVYHESSMARTPRKSVVLGDPAHALQNLDCAFENAPQSLRDVEKTLRIGVRS